MHRLNVCCRNVPALLSCRNAASKAFHRSFWNEGRGRRGGSMVPYRPSTIFNELQNVAAAMERDFDRWTGFRDWRPFVGMDFEHPTVTEFFRLKNPIIEENGVKKFKLEFDVRRFRPEDVKLASDSASRTLTIEAKHEDEHSKFEYSRKITVPEGVDLKEITGKYTSDGVLVLSAPYTELPRKDLPPKETVLEIEHK